jgi:hypothetical protein
MIPFTLAALGGTAALSAQQNSSRDWQLPLLQASMETKKGMTLNVRGQMMAMVVTAIGDHFVEGRSQQASRIVVRLASIDAASMA